MKQMLSAIYRTRYSMMDEVKKNSLWRVLTHDFLQQYISKDDVVLDIAAGHCEFINAVTAKKKYAVDINPRIKTHAADNVTVVICDAQKLPLSLTRKIDCVFMGCFLEHLPSKEAIVRVFEEVQRVLVSGGTLLILNPNIRFLASEYWDYFDHLTPVSDRSVVEILTALGYTIERCIPRFVPNTIKDHLPKSPWLVKLYLRLPFLYPIFGRQMFIVARK